MKATYPHVYRWRLSNTVGTPRFNNSKTRPRGWKTVSGTVLSQKVKFLQVSDLKLQFRGGVCDDDGRWELDFRTVEECIMSDLMLLLKSSQNTKCKQQWPTSCQFQFFFVPQPVLSSRFPVTYQTRVQLRFFSTLGYWKNILVGTVLNNNKKKN